ncbi:MAG: hypothetical protein HUJ72_00805 [Blautia sp.]|nr:hypothetical protein [Blautia sp.]
MASMTGQSEQLQLVQAGVRLTTEKDPNRLLETLPSQAMVLTYCGAGTTTDQLLSPAVLVPLSHKPVLEL